MITLLLAASAATGTWLIIGATPLGGAMTDSGRDAGPGAATSSATRAVDAVIAATRRWVRDRDLGPIEPNRFLAGTAASAVASATAATLLVGPGVPTVAAAAVGATLPTTLWRRRRDAEHQEAAEAWPRMIEELRVLAGAAGKPIPQALVEVGLRGPESMRPAFAAAQREWALGADPEAMVASLKAALADATADVALETLLVAHQVGGDVDGRLAALAEDRRRCLADRKEADSRQAGARVARWFVVVVPLGMAFVGTSLGDGADAYRTPVGQLAVAVAVALVGACWWWAGRMMRLPRERRVLGS